MYNGNQDSQTLAERVDYLEGRIMATDSAAQDGIDRIEGKVDTLLGDVRELNLRVAALSILQTKVGEKVGVESSELESLHPGPDDTLVTRIDKIRAEAKRDKRRRNMTMHPVKTRAVEWSKYVAMAVGALVTMSIAVKEIAEIVKELAHKFGG